MADNIVLNAGSGGDTCAADDIGGVKIPVVKIKLGDNSSDDGYVYSSNPMPVMIIPVNSYGMSIHKSLDLDEGSLEVPKASAGTVYGMWATNRSSSTLYIKFYNATSGTVGTGTPVITIGIPGNSTDDISGSFGPGGAGIAFSTGISVGCSTGFADNDTGAPGTNDMIVAIFYK